MTDQANEQLMRGAMAGAGGLAGFSVWMLVDVLPDALQNQWLYLWISSAICGFFTLLLGLVGPLKIREALGVASVLGLFAAALFYWSSLRYTGFNDIFDSGFEPVAFAVLIFVGAPFGAAVMRGRVWDYAYLFDTAWGITVRYLAGFVFVGLFWAALFLSHALLEIVGISVIWDFVEIDMVPYVLSGLVLGLALAVAYELRDYVSPYLLVRLLRLLMPPLVAVVAVFILALPLRGLSGLFGDFSAAATLMAVAIAGASLITAALDSSDAEAVGSGFMRLVTQAFAAMLPILGVLAVWAVVIRISDYGWTPERLAAFVASLFVLAYGVLYGVSVLRPDWMARIRQANIYHALALLVAAALWLTPLLDATRISANTQVARYLKGISSLENLPAWEIANDWGVAGTRALAELDALEAEDHPGLVTLLERASSDSRWEFKRNTDKQSKAEMAKAALAVARVLPEASALDVADLAALSRFNLERISEACIKHRCAFVVGNIGVSGSRKVVSFLGLAGGGAEVLLFGEGTAVRFYLEQRSLDIDQAAFDQLLGGNFRIAPSSLQSIWIGDVEIGAGQFGNMFVVEPIE